MGIKVLQGVLFQNKGDLRSTSQSIAARVRVYLERAVLCRRAEYVLNRVGILLGFGTNRRHIYVIGDQETVET